MIERMGDGSQTPDVLPSTSLMLGAHEHSFSRLILLIGILSPREPFLYQ